MDKELHRFVLEARRGNQEAFGELVRRFKQNVFRHACGMLGDRLEAEDAAQETFIKAFYALPRLEAGHAFASWLMRIASNVCLDRVRKRANDPTATHDALPESATDSRDQTHLRLALEEAMRQLSVEHRQVIVLHDIQGYRYEEMADFLNIPIGTVKSRLNAARMSLRNEWKRGDGS